MKFLKFRQSLLLTIIQDVPNPPVGIRTEGNMFYPVRVFNKRGKLKKEVTSQALSRNYWSKVFDPARKNIQISVQGLSKKDREKLGWELDDNNFSED